MMQEKYYSGTSLGLPIKLRQNLALNLLIIKKNSDFKPVREQVEIPSDTDKYLRGYRQLLVLDSNSKVPHNSFWIWKQMG